MEVMLSSATDDAPSNLQQGLEALARRYQVDELYVFGSRADEIAGRLRG